MHNLRYCLYTLIFIFLFPQMTFAQEKNKNVIFSYLPQYTLIKGLRTDFDIRLNRNTWLVCAPQFFLDHKYGKNEIIEESPYENSDYNQMSGAGIDLHLKFLFENNFFPFSIYYAFGPTMRYFDITKFAYTWIEKTHNGLPVLNYEPGEINELHYQVSFNTLIGIQKDFKRFIIDAFIGGALRYSFSDNNDFRTTSNSMLDYSYTGALPVAGIKFGIIL